MTEKLFGTDGIRGQANTHPMTANQLLTVAQAAATLFLRGDHRHRVVIGKDTRLSGYMFEPALTAGFISAGMDVVLTGPLPTPAIAMLTKSLRADLGVMISASHNPYEDNGVKFFGPDGYKLTDEQENFISSLVANPSQIKLADTSHLGRATRMADAEGRYIEWMKATFPDDLRLDGVKIVLDCANGAAYKVAPAVLWELGAEVITLANSPNGKNINALCGATHPQLMQEAVIMHQADIGLALDGDADRLIVADEKGRVVDGDQLLATIALAYAKAGRLKGGGIAATVMSNMGLEKTIAAKGLTLHRTAVGDRYVMEKMRELQLNVGGEQSGHIILADDVTTGDALIAALQVLAALCRSRTSASSVLHQFDPFPQVLVNVRVSNAAQALQAEHFQTMCQKAEKDLGPRGRLVIRKSGTEPVVRIMVEADDMSLTQKWADELKNAINRS